MCSPTTKHDLGITLSLDSTLTFEFPHKEWASKFLQLLDESAHKDTCKPKARTSPSYGVGVRLDLPKTVVGVHFRRAPDDERHHLTFIFDNATSAQAWAKGLDGSDLWKADPGGRDDSLAFPLVWSHEDFASAVDKNNRGRYGDPHMWRSAIREEEMHSASKDKKSKSLARTWTKKGRNSASDRSVKQIAVAGVRHFFQNNDQDRRNERYQRGERYQGNEQYQRNERNQRGSRRAIYIVDTGARQTNTPANDLGT